VGAHDGAVLDGGAVSLSTIGRIPSAASSA
jgi:hypothetical protein